VKRASYVSFLIAALGCVLSLSRIAAAGEHAEMMYSRGLVEFHGERYQQAMPWFDRAVEMDPADAEARYYRAMTLARLGNRGDAIADLQHAVDLHPAFHPARLELAGLLIEEQRHGEAIAHLRELQHLPEYEGRAAFLIGITRLRQEELDAADESFRYAAQRDPKLAATSSYYRGIIAYRRNQAHRARRELRAALRSNPGAGVGREAAGGLQALRNGAAKRFMLYAEAGVQYDSNVCLLPDEDGSIANRDGCFSFDSSDIGEGSIGDEGDGRGIFTAGALVRPLMTERVQLTVGYEVYQSVHFDLSQFDLQDHRPRLQLTADLGPILLGALGQYDYYLLQDNSFLQEMTGVAWMIVPEGEIGRFELFFRERRRDFKMLLFDVRDAFNHSPGARQLFFLGSPERYAYLGYRFDHEDPDDTTARFSNLDAQAFQYNGHEASTGVRWMWPLEIPMELSFAYRHERYDEASITNASLPRRRDHEYRARGSLELPWSLFLPDWDFASNLSFGLAYMWNLNDSNQANFDYDRHIASATLQLRY